MNIPSSEELDSMFQELKTVLTHPEFQKAFDEVASLPVEQRVPAVFTKLTLGALAARGVQIPRSMSFSTHNSETSNASGDTTINTAEPGTAVMSPMDAHSDDNRVCYSIAGITVCFTIMRRFPPGPGPGLQ